jgi:hypothetical protein
MELGRKRTTDMETTAKSAIIGFATVMLTICTTATAGVVSTPRDKGLVIFEATEFAKSTPQRVTFVDIWQEEEYVRFEGNGARSEIIYAVADERDSVVLNVELTLAKSLKTWRANSAIALGEKGSVEAPLGTFEYQLYTQSNENRHCVGFLNEWDYRAGDPELRPAKALFGYYCAKPGAKLSKTKVAGLFIDIWIEGIERIDVRFTPRLTLSSMSGAGRTTTGNTGFPYVMADIFNDADGERSAN